MTALRWERTVLRRLEWVANPALAGLAFCLLSVGVVTWLPALASAAHALHRWRSEDDQRCFVGVFESFGHYWRLLWRDSVASTAVVAALLANLLFLAGQAAPAAFALFAVQLGIAAVLTPYHLSLAALAGRDPGAGPKSWRRRAVLLGFGGWRGPLLCATTATVVLATIPTGVGPLLFGPTVPLLVALTLAGRDVPDPRGRP